MEHDPDGMLAERLDRTVETDLGARDGEAAFRDDFGDVARGDRTVKLSAFAGLTQSNEALAVKLLGNGFGILLLLQVLGLKLGALGFECARLPFVALSALPFGSRKLRA
jgi:hypothetical protein